MNTFIIESVVRMIDEIHQFLKVYLVKTSAINALFYVCHCAERFLDYSVAAGNQISFENRFQWIKELSYKEW